MKLILKQFLSRDTHPFVQFIKYGICGALATAVDIVISSLLAWKVFPALEEDELVVKLFKLHVEDMPDAERAINFFYCSALAFIISNLVAYVTNFMWVFESGRHDRKKEITYFYVVSLISFGIAVGAGTFLVNAYQVSYGVALVVKIVVSVMINYAGRKFFVFKG